MRDPLEGLTADGRIRTGAHQSRIVEAYRPILEAAVDLVGRNDTDHSVYVYGSVATGEALAPASDVDLLTIGLPSAGAEEIGRRLSAEFGALCRSVDIAAAMVNDNDGDGDEAYGGRVFLHHYCVHLGGPDRDRATTAFRGDRRAARGFNGDIGRHADRWRGDLASSDPAMLGRRLARKTLLAVAGLVSVHDTTWTTDRLGSAQRWSELQPDLADGLATLLDWSSERSRADRDGIARQLDVTVDHVVSRFADTIGLWRG